MALSKNISKLAALSAYLLLAIFVILRFFKPIECGDIWWHLSVGRWIFDHHQFPVIDILSPLSTPKDWILTQGGGSCVYYAIYHLFGFIGLKVFRLCLFIGILLIFWQWSKRRVPPVIQLFLLVLLVFALSSRALLRPLVFNFIFIQLFLIILFDAKNNNAPKKLLFIPILSVFWFNLHLGSFVYGIPLIGLFLLYFIIEHFKLKKTGELNFDQLNNLDQKIKFLAITVILNFIAFIINPYGLKGALYPFRAIFDKDFIINKYLTQTIIELNPPVFILSWSGVWVFMLLFLTIVFVWKNKTSRFLYTLLLGFSFFLFLYSARAGAFYAIVCCYIIGDIADQIELKGAWKQYVITRKWRWEPIFYSVICAFLMAHSLHYFNQKIYQNGETVRYFSTLIDPYTPEENLKILERYNLGGNVFNWDGYGGYIAWEKYPEIRPFIDGRQADAEIYLDYLRAVNKPKKYWVQLEAKYNFILALIDVNFGSLYKITEYLIHDPNWRVISINGSSFLLAKTDSFDLPEQLLAYENTLNQDRISAAYSVGLTVKEGFIQKIRNFIYPPYVYIDEFEKAVALYSSGFKNAGLNNLISSYKNTKDTKILKLINIISRNDKK